MKMTCTCHHPTQPNKQSMSAISQLLLCKFCIKIKNKEHWIMIFCMFLTLAKLQKLERAKKIGASTPLFLGALINFHKRSFFYSSTPCLKNVDKGIKNKRYRFFA